MGRTSVMVTREILYPGMRVCRGRDWKWDTQDSVNGIQQPGTIKALTPPSDGWITVHWDNKESAPHYRVGAEGCYDLYLWEDAQDAGITSYTQIQVGDRIIVLKADDYYMKENSLTVGQVCTVTHISSSHDDQIRVDNKTWWVDCKYFRKEVSDPATRGPRLTYCHEVSVGEIIVVDNYNDSYITSWGLVLGQEFELVEKHSNNTHIKIKGYSSWVKINCFRKKVGGYVPPAAPDGPVITGDLADWSKCTHILKVPMEVLVINDTLSHWVKSGGLKKGDIVTLNGIGSTSFLVKTPIHGNLNIDRRCFGLPSQGVVGSVFINCKIKITANERRTSPRAVQVRRQTPSIRSAKGGNGSAIRS